MEKKVNIRDPLRYFSKALDIFHAFRENGISLESSIVLMNLYDEALQHQELMEKTKIESSGEFMLVITDGKIRFSQIKYVTIGISW